MHPTTPKIGREMLAFADKHFPMFTDIIGVRGEHNYYRGPLPSKELSYCNRRGHIGFDYNSSDEEREWVYTLIRWMAVKVGRRTRAGFPRYLYDGHEWIEMKSDEVKPEFISILYSKRLLKKLAAEIKKLDKLWENRADARTKQN